MEVKTTPLEGCYILIPGIIEDTRGRFVKPFHIDDYSRSGLYFAIAEEYYSVSNKHVLRGLHFQIPPRATRKIVTCLNGRILDAVVDLRKASATYLRHFTLELSGENGRLLYIPEGFAHGFCALSDEATVLYMCSEMFSPEHDSGIRWNSAGIPWPVADPLVSLKDSRLAELHEFDNPF